MSQVALLDNPADRRRHSRRSVYRSAELVLRGGRDGLDCTVLDESDGGVQLELAQALELPEEAIIRFSDTASQLVRRCWANGTRAGYQYIDIVPAQRSWSPGVSPPPAQARANFTAFNDFIHVSRPLLELSGEPGELLYPAEEIHAWLRGEPRARQQPTYRGSGRENIRELFAIPRMMEPEAIAERGFFEPRWVA